MTDDDSKMLNRDRCWRRNIPVIPQGLGDPRTLKSVTQKNRDPAGLLPGRTKNVSKDV